MFRNLTLKYIFSALLSLVVLGIFWIVIAALVPSLQIIFPVFIAPIFLGMLLGILVPIIRSGRTKKSNKDEE